MYNSVYDIKDSVRFKSRHQARQLFNRIEESKTTLAKITDITGGTEKNPTWGEKYRNKPLGFF